MMAARQEPPQSGEYWHFSMGLPENNGWSRSSQSNGETVEMTAQGMHVTTLSTDYVLWVPPTSVCNSGIAEFEVIPIITPKGAWNNQKGIRLQLSNGSAGFKIFFRRPESGQDYIQNRYNSGTGAHNISPVFEGHTFVLGEKNHCVIKNNIDGKTIVTLPRNSLTNYETFEYDWFNKSQYQCIYNAFGLLDACEVYFVSARFTPLS
jgi:hypothetical protein